MGKLSGSLTFITGASSGIGAAVAREAARQGSDVVITARRLERLSALAKQIETMGRRVLAVSCDVTRDGDLEAAVAKTEETFGRIDQVIANAGFGVVGSFERLNIEDYRRQFETNVFGVLRTVRATREHLIASHGCLAIVGSVNGYVPVPGASPYCMSKAAVHALAFTLRHEFRRHGVGVVLIAPGFVKSEIRQVDNRGVHHPQARDHIPSWLSASSEKAARQILLAVRKRQPVKAITGHAKVAIFLQRHCPRLLSMLIHSFSGREPSSGGQHR